MSDDPRSATRIGRDGHEIVGRTRGVLGRVDTRGVAPDAQFEHARKALHSSRLGVERFERLPWINHGHVRIGAWCTGTTSVLAYSHIEDPNHLRLTLPERTRRPLWIVLSSTPTITRTVHAAKDVPAGGLAVVLSRHLELSTLRRSSRLVLGVDAARLGSAWRSRVLPPQCVVRPATWQVDLLESTGLTVLTMARDRTHAPSAEIIDNYVASLTGLVAGPVLRAFSEGEGDRRRDDRRVAAARFIAANIHRADLSAAVIAEHLHISNRQLSRDFADTAGGVAAAVLEARIARAVRMLLEQAPEQPIAARCGFSSHSQFTRVFRKRFGVPPSAYAADIECPRNGSIPLRRLDGARRTLREADLDHER